MMRGPGNWAVAVRTPNGKIAQVSRQIDSAMARHRILRLPVVRGVIALGESLAIGFRALAISANYAAQEKDAEGEEVDTELSRGALIFAFAIAIGFAVMLFKVTPALIVNWLPIKGTGWFVIVEGLIRVTIFVLYLSVISLLPDLRRVFQYHGAEHKAINAYEAGEDLEPSVVQRYSLIHPRRGTATSRAGQAASPATPARSRICRPRCLPGSAGSRGRRARRSCSHPRTPAASGWASLRSSRIPTRAWRCGRRSAWTRSTARAIRSSRPRLRSAVAFRASPQRSGRRRSPPPTRAARSRRC